MDTSFAHEHVLHVETCFACGHMFSSWTHGDVLHVDIGHVSHVGTFYTWTRFAQHSAAAATGEWDAGDREAALAPSPGSGATPPGNYNSRHAGPPRAGRAAPARRLAPPSRPGAVAGPGPRHRQSPGRRARGARQRAAWSPALRTATSWATWVRAGRSGRFGCRPRVQGTRGGGAGKRARTAGAGSWGSRGASDDIRSEIGDAPG